jgi:quercetin dioxygenase-like cupin family protein
VSPGHLVRWAAEAAPVVPDELAGHSEGFRHWPIVGEASGAVHTGFATCELEPGGWVSTHVHSFEETVFVLSGTADIRSGEGAYRLGPGDYGVVPVGVPHGWRNEGPGAARWAEMAAPQPRARFGADTFVAEDDAEGPVPRTVDPRDPRTRSFGHIEPGNMDVDKQNQDMLAVSASMRTALLVYSGITVKMMVDADLGAQLSTMFMVQYEPRGFAGPHDHPFEETYLIVEGEVDAAFDGERYRLATGDVAWAGVGCVHEFSNPTQGGLVRWLETQAPQPPARHSYRFARDWTYLRDRLR